MGVFMHPVATMFINFVNIKCRLTFRRQYCILSLSDREKPKHMPPASASSSRSTSYAWRGLQHTSRQFVTRDEFIRQHRHELAGMILDAWQEHRTGSQGSVWLRKILAEVDEKVGAIFDSATKEPPREMAIRLIEAWKLLPASDQNEIVEMFRIAFTRPKEPPK